MEELREFRVERKVVATQEIFVNAVDKEEAVALAIRSPHYEWETQAMPQEIPRTEMATESPEE